MDRIFGGTTRRAALAGGAALAVAALAPRPAAAQFLARAARPTGELGILSDGGLTLPLSAVARGVPEATLSTLLAEAGHSGPTIQSSLNVPLLKRGSEVILFDCGAGPNFMATAGKLPAAMTAAGIDPASVGHVLLTHAHPDHLWGAIDDFDAPAYANATYHLPQGEWDFWMDPGIFGRLPETQHAFAAGAQRILKLIEPQLKRFRPGEEPVSGIAAIGTPGHTPGHVSFEVRAGGDPFVVTGDAITHPVVSFQRPDWAGGFDRDGEQAVASRRRLLDRLVTDRLLLSAYHLPGGGLGRAEKSGTAFRFVPA
ncbi:MBL fold metallo-hydrolase [Phreatobacter sp.]|uniref:MBL fold metallo-hydrolase n=1 Tax=Phreatobacter sp. TaxID=1966341 RepID=UPI003F6ECC95